MQFKLSKALAKPSLVSITARVRWEKEIAGSFWGQYPIHTDRESQAMVSGAVAYLQNKPPQTTVNFRTPVGFTTLALDGVTAIALAVGDHVQACFDKQQEIEAAIEAGTIKTEAEIIAAFSVIPSPNLG